MPCYRASSENVYLAEKFQVFKNPVKGFVHHLILSQQNSVITSIRYFSMTNSNFVFSFTCKVPKFFKNLYQNFIFICHFVHVHCVSTFLNLVQSSLKSQVKDIKYGAPDYVIFSGFSLLVWSNVFSPFFLPKRIQFIFFPHSSGPSFAPAQKRYNFILFNFLTILLG
jgi:hypothetical protein